MKNQESKEIEKLIDSLSSDPLNTDSVEYKTQQKAKEDSRLVTQTNSSISDTITSDQKLENNCIKNENSDSKDEELIEMQIALQEDEEALINSKTNEIKKIKRKKLILREILIVGFGILILSCLVFLLTFVKLNTNYVTLFNDYTFAIPIFIHCSYFGVILELCLILISFLVRPSRIKPGFKKKSHIVFFIIFQLLGILAFVLMNQILIVTTYKIKLNQLISLYITSIITLIYSYLIYKLFVEGFIYSKQIFFEIFRFSLVGLVAALCDYIVTTLVRFAFVSLSHTWYATVVAVTCGFIVGVTINYVLSVFMVYKSNKTNLSKTKKGVALFVILSAVGLFIGYAIELVFYNEHVIKIEPYILVFLIRTIIVMIYNYLTRKFILFK